MLAGFHTMGWTTENTAKEMAKKSANAAVVEALAPICVDKFLRAVEYEEPGRTDESVRRIKARSLRRAVGRRYPATAPPMVRQWRKRAPKCSALSSNQGLARSSIRRKLVQASPSAICRRRRHSSCPIAFFTRVTRSGEAEVSLLASAWACAALRGSMSMLRFCASAREAVLHEAVERLAQHGDAVRGHAGPTAMARPKGVPAARNSTMSFLSGASSSASGRPAGLCARA